MSWIAPIARRPRLVVGAGLLVSALALHPLTSLRLSTDLLALLPAGSAAAESYRVYLERFGALEKVFVLIQADPGADGLPAATLARAADEMEELLAQSPEVASVRAGLEDRDEELFLRHVLPRAPLLVRGDWRGRMEQRLEPAAIHDRVARLRSTLQTPAGLASATLARSDPLGLGESLAALRAPSGLPLDPLTSTFVSPDGRAALLLLTPSRAEIDPEGGRALAAEIEAAARQLRERIGVPLTVQAAGGPLYAAHDEAVLRQDLRRTLTGSLIGTAAILVLAFEGPVLPVVVLLPLLCGLAWTGAALSLLGVELSAVTIGFGAVLVGLGVDYGIHGGARFRSQLVDTPDPAAAMVATAGHAGPGILASALTTAAAFATLGLAHLPPLRELGLLVALGCLAILTAVGTLGAAGLVLVAPWLRRPGPLWRAQGRAVERLSGLAARFPGTVLTTAAVLTAVAVWGLVRISIQPDLRALRPENHPVEETEKLLVERFSLGLDTANVLVRGRDLGEALGKAGRAADVLRRRLGPDVRVTCPADYLSGGETKARRLTELAELPFGRAAADLERELRAAGLNPKAFELGLEALRAFARGEDPGAPEPSAWPDWLAESVRFGDAGEAWLALGLRLPAGSWPDGPPEALLAEVDAAAPGSLFASAVALGNELRTLAGRDFKALAGWAFLAVFLIVVISFRGRLGYSALTLLPVTLGSFWALGFWSAAGWELDLFSLAVLPILLGIGLDDGLHVVHGAARFGGLRASIVGVGHGLLLTTLTTCVGFASLGLSRIPSLRNGGLLIAAGVLACWVSTVFVLPAVESFSERFR